MLPVPARRGSPAGDCVALAFVRLRSPRAPGANPIVYLEGGPGIPVTWQATDPERLRAWLDLLDAGDVVLVDHRGVGRSAPALTWKWPGDVPTGVFARREDALAHVLEMSRRARAEFDARGIDLRGYTPLECVEDVEDLCIALGLERVSLLGFSFGAQLALAYLRRHPGRVERVVAAGVEGPPHAFKLPLGLDAHLGRLGVLEAARRVAGRLDSSPVTVRVEMKDSGAIRELPVGRFGLGLLLKEWLGHRDFVESLPALLGAIERGEHRLLEERVRRTFGMFVRLNGPLLLIDGSSGASAERWLEIERQARESLFGGVVNFPFPEVDEIWKPADVGDGYRSVVVSDRPVLLLSGSLDWNSPPHQAEEMLRGLRNGTHHVVERATHLEILRDPVARRAAVEFLRARP